MKQRCALCYTENVRLWVHADRAKPTVDELVCLRCAKEGVPYVRAVSLDSGVRLVTEQRGPLHLLWRSLPEAPDPRTETRRRAENG